MFDLLDLFDGVIEFIGELLADAFESTIDRTSREFYDR